MPKMTGMNIDCKVKGQETAHIFGIVPAYNEAEAIGDVIARVRKHIPVLVIDDGSSDKTAQVAEQGGADVYRQSPNQGKGAALRAGFDIALKHGYQAVLTLDADGQHDPDEIPSFLDAYQLTGADLIIGERDFSQIPPVRRMANTLGMWSFSWAVGQQIKDNQSGYRLISRRMMLAAGESHESGFEFEVEMIVTCIQRGYQLGWVPIRTIYRGEESHIHPFKHTIEFTRMVLQTRSKMRKFGN
jgi:glycosyltransferase involved in cell wall biosynthesis